MNLPKTGLVLLALCLGFSPMPIFSQDNLPTSPKQYSGVIAYISPNLDGIQDTLRLPLKIQDERYIISYSLTIRGEDGQVVRVIRNKETRPETADFGNLVQRFLRVKAGLKLPKFLVWDGRNNDGAVVADGLYTYQLEVSDDNNNIARTDPRSVILDTKPPVLKIDAPQTAFAPGGDRSQLIINQSCDESLAPIEKWDAGIFNPDGLLVRSWTYHAKLPTQTIWDGKNNDGILAPDGIYTFRLVTSDRAGNRASAEIPNLLLLNQATPISLTVDNAWFSPNGDGIKDVVTVTINANDQVKAVNWVARLNDSGGSTVKTYRGSGSLPQTLEITGLDETGKAFPEGSYQVVFTALYVNGNKPIAESPPIILNLTKPSITVVPDTPIFSPNADGNKDQVTIKQTASLEPVWEGRIVQDTRNSAAIIRTWTWRNYPDAALVWDGRDQNGVIVPDGDYTYQAQATDLAGNTGLSTPVVMRVDNRHVGLSIRPGRAAFSPGTDSTYKVMNFELGQTVNDGVESWQIRILASPLGSSSTIRSWNGSGLPLPPVIWDGTKADGTLAPDGPYVAEYSLVYQKGDRPIALSSSFMLDTHRPEVSVNTDNPYFSPDGDGKQDVLVIKQQTSVEDTWKGTISNFQGKVVKTFVWNGKAPEILNWDGTDNAGNKLPDGEYQYELAAQDAAGNAGSALLGGLKLSTVKPELTLTISTPAFSPNGDGINDVVEFVPGLKITSDVKSWKLQIKPVKGGSARTVVGTESVPAKLFWDGKTDGGRLAPEGDYQALLTVEYKSGQTPTVLSPKVTLDITPPTASVFADPTLFSPNGDGFKDGTIITQDLSKEAVWVGTIRAVNPPADATDSVVRSFTWVGKPPKSFMWDGTNNQGATVPDGRYTYQASARDGAGNSGMSAPIEIQVDNRPTPLSIKPDVLWFSPGNAGKQAKLSLSTSLGLNEGIESWAVEIHEANGELIRTIKGSSVPPAIVEWDGRTDSGLLVADGDFFAVLRLIYLKGDRPNAKSEPFTVDTKAPQISVAVENSLFSPDGDGFQDVVTIKQVSSSEELWEGAIFNAAGTQVRSYFWKTLASNFSWDGRDDNGNPQPDGNYSYVVSATDQAGNSTKVEVKNIVIDTRPTPVLLTANSKGFSPGVNRPNLATIGFNPILGLVDGVVGWTLNLVNLSNGNAIERSFSGAGVPPTNLVWDGTRNDTTLAPDGRYEAVLNLEYRKGNRPEARSSVFVLNRRGPQVHVGIKPKPFSPDDDGENDEVTIALSIEDLSPIKDWNLEILDPQGNHFITFAGQGEPTNRITWNGLSDKGELVQSAVDYVALLTVTDSLENRTITREPIPVDVLVLRDGDQLRIRIPGISFPTNSADLASDFLDRNKVTQNGKILDRLAEILRKYGSYQITVEGYANITQYADPKLADQENREQLIPLSEKRAVAVRDALVKRGIAGGRMSVLGKGGSQPVVPNTDLANIWKNRRMEFILKK